MYFSSFSPLTHWPSCAEFLEVPWRSATTQHYFFHLCSFHKYANQCIGVQWAHLDFIIACLQSSPFCFLKYRAMYPTCYSLSSLGNPQGHSEAHLRPNSLFHQNVMTNSMSSTITNLFLKEETRCDVYWLPFNLYILYSLSIWFQILHSYICAFPLPQSFAKRQE